MTLEIPTITIFGNGPVFTLTLREQDGAKILKSECQNKLKKKPYRLPLHQTLERVDRCSYGE